ncbi:MAG: hypothetical protein GXO19_00030 [Epsilonproteobacteria bacterium]|nr:hypothetical protein [Campylobacterota bacterium]NPA56098.1 hypothetical protein [Campylobacterota bacterium]
MYKIEMDKLCSCAKRDESLQERWLSKEYESRESAELEGLRLANHANANWCKKHRFFAYEEEGESIVRIAVELSCPKEI